MRTVYSVCWSPSQWRWSSLSPAYVRAGIVNLRAGDGGGEDFHMAGARVIPERVDRARAGREALIVADPGAALTLLVAPRRIKGGAGDPPAWPEACTVRAGPRQEDVDMPVCQ